jgi:iron-sulfur cluster assembly protein
MSVIVTDNAAKEIASIIKAQELDPAKVCLRIGVKGGGCSGFSYILDLTESMRDSDEVWEKAYEVKNGSEGGEPFTLRVVCDPKRFHYLSGTPIDFKDEIMGRGFVVNNPNATSTCGCGSSFSA